MTTTVVGTTFKLFLFSWLVYAVFATPAGGVTPNRYVDLVHSIVNEGRFAIDTYQENTIDKAYYNGHYYAGALPGPAFLAVPAYLAFKGLYALLPQSFNQLAGGIQSYQITKQADSSFYGRIDNVEFFLSQLFLTLTVLASTAAAGVAMVFRSMVLLGYKEKDALIVSSFYAFGTIAFFYSTIFFEQIFSATLAISAFYLILNATKNINQEGGRVLLLIAGLLSGCGLLVEYPTAFIALWMGIWLFTSTRDWKPAALYLIGGITPVLVLLAYNYALFNNPLSTPYAHLIAEFDSVHGIGFFGATYPHIDRLFGLLFGDERGLFLFAPITLVGFVGLVDEILERKRNFIAAAVCGGITASYIVFFSSYTNWRGGAAFGPRYLIATLPFIALGIAFAFEALPKRLIYLVGGLSIFINWTGAQFGFAANITQHIGDLFVQGPSLPALDAIITHSTSHLSDPYLFAEHYHIVLTLTLILGLFGLFLWMFRNLLLPGRGLPGADLTAALAENRPRARQDRGISS